MAIGSAHGQDRSAQELEFALSALGQGGGRNRRARVRLPMAQPGHAHAIALLAGSATTEPGCAHASPVRIA